jgi:hypothetical protein
MYKILSASLLAGCFFVAGCGNYSVNNNLAQPKMYSSVEEAIVAYEEKNINPKNEGKRLCVAEVVKSIDGDSVDEQLVSASVNCVYAVMRDGDVRSTSGGEYGPFYKVKKQNNEWVVLDAEQTISPSQVPSKEWAEKIFKIEPNPYILTDGMSLSAQLSEKAGKIFNIPVRSAKFASCKKDSDCQSNEVCYLEGPHANYKNNKCVQKCSTHQECGAAYTCRGQCIHGENGCPKTAVNVCMPDIIHTDFDKTGKPL